MLWEGDNGCVSPTRNRACSPTFRRSLISPRYYIATYYIGTTLHTCGRVVRSGRVDGMGACDPTRPTPPGPTGRGPTREGGIGTETHLTWHCRIPMHILMQYPRTIRHSGACMKVCVCVPYIAPYIEPNTGASSCVFGSRVHRKNNSIITSYQRYDVDCRACLYTVDRRYRRGHASKYIPGSNKDGCVASFYKLGRHEHASRDDLHLQERQRRRALMRRQRHAVAQPVADGRRSR